MMQVLLYALFSLAVLALALWAVRSSARGEAPSEGQPPPTAGLLEGAALIVAERIFDPGDYRWLREDLCFPQAAETLARHRRQLAIQWLRALRASFKEIVRQPESPGETPRDDIHSWQLLGETIRIHFLLGYALFVVRVFGPYHRLVPSFGWAGKLGDLAKRRETVHATHHFR